MSTALPLMEIVNTIQGEGYHQGKAAVFIRLAGCDVGCPWCDIKESWNPKPYPEVDVSTIALEAAGFNSRIAVVTGGEPLMHDLSDLTKALKNKGMQTHLETSGAYPLTGEWDWVCFSPKKFKKPVKNFGRQSDEIKVIIAGKRDFEWAEQFLNEVNGINCKKFLQPEWDRSQKMLPEVVNYVKNNPEWEISLQIHKFMHIP